MTTTTAYSVPSESSHLFHHGILSNPLISPHLPTGLQALGHLVHFSGHALPSVPINWRLAESIAALKAFEATMVNLLLVRKYNMAGVEVGINTDHASLFFMAIPLARIVDDTQEERREVKIDHVSDPLTMRLFPGQDKHRATDGVHRVMATSIYKTHDGRFYHIHGSMNPDPVLTALGLPLDGAADDTFETAVSRIQGAVLKFDAAQLDQVMNGEYRQAGTIAYSADEYFSSAHGQANAKVGLYELIRAPNSRQVASWWPSHASLPSSPQRPLAGLKIVDLTRVIAGPTITRGLAELGASVMRVVSPHVTDFTTCHHELNWGKWNAFLHLKDEADRVRLRALISEADVVVDGYRPGVMDRLGFGREEVFKMVEGRERGIVHVRENCYGWYGPWKDRSGWQGISDACCGVSMAYGQAMGVDGAVTPPFPNSDCCTGVIGSTAVLHALMERAEHGGSYGVDASLNYYSQWLVRSCSVYPPSIWSHLRSPKFQHHDNTRRTLPQMLSHLHQSPTREILLNPEFFELRPSKALGGVVFRTVRPIARWMEGTVELGFNVGTRGNGVDEARWPEDLGTEIVG